MVQLLEIYHATQELDVSFRNIYNDLRKVMGVVPGCTLLVWIFLKVAFFVKLN